MTAFVYSVSTELVLAEDILGEKLFVFVFICLFGIYRAGPG